MSLARLVTSPGYRTPFRVRRTAPGRDAAVSLLIDCSGSMAGRKIELARLCAAALRCADAARLRMRSARLPPSRMPRCARTTSAGSTPAATRSANRFVERLDLRLQALRFRQPERPRVHRMRPRESRRGVELAAGRLLAARRRILMVLSDGYPATGDNNPDPAHRPAGRVDALRGARRTDRCRNTRRCGGNLLSGQQRGRASARAAGRGVRCIERYTAGSAQPRARQGRSTLRFAGASHRTVSIAGGRLESPR